MLSNAADVGHSFRFLRELEAAERSATQTEGKIIRHFLGVWQDLPLLSAAEIAQDIGVNPSSITRTAQTLGYRGYPDLQRTVRQALLSQHLPAPLPADSHGNVHWEREIEVFKRMKQFPEELLNQCASKLAQARRVYLYGARGSAPAAAYSAYLWRGIRPDVLLLDEQAAEFPEQWMEANESDVLVVFTVKRYAQSTRRVLEIFTQQQVPLVLITDSEMAPGARYATTLLVLPTYADTAARMPVGRFVTLTLPSSLSALIASKLIERLGPQRLEAIQRKLGENDVFTI